MLVDLTAAQVLAGLVTPSQDASEAGRWAAEHPWRLLALLDRDPALTPAAQADAWAQARPADDDLMLLPAGSAALTPATPAWWACKAAHGLAEGLAYGRIVRPGVPFQPRSPDEANTLELVRTVAGLFAAPACLMAAASVSDHTFDVFGLLYDAHRLAVLLVVDED